MTQNDFRSTVLGVLLALASTSFMQAQELLPVPAPSIPPSMTAPVAKQDPVELLKMSYLDLKDGKVDTALAEVNVFIEANSLNRPAHLLRALIYAEQQQWDKASSEYDTVLAINPNDITAKFDQAELKFMQKKYDEARLGFAGVLGDPDMADFATYKVFLCDLFGGHEDMAAKDLDAINNVGGNPSYYFANVAWDLAHNKPEDAADWLKSANWIYANAPEKCLRYATSLKDHGYLPIHLSSN